MRVTSFGAAAAVSIAVLWATGLYPTRWVVWVAEFFEDSAPTAATGADGKADPASSVSPVIPFESAKPLAGTDSSISEVPLPLYLVSVEPGRNSREGTARIGTSVNNPQTYAAGALLSNGARLIEIHADHVVFKRGDRSARLQLYDQRSPASANPDELLNVGGAVKQVSVAPPAVNEPLTDYLRPNPIFEGELLRGYELYPGNNRRVFSQLGLQPGDVLIAIDGVAVTDAEQTLQMLRELSSGVALTVTLERKQQRQTVTLDGGVIISDRDRAQSLSANGSGN